MNVYQIITERIIDSLSNGVVPWRRPWHTDAPRNLVSNREYRGVNVLVLQASPYESPYWLTFNQARNLGGTVRKGERGTPVVFWKVSSEDRDERDEPEKRFVLRYFTVFNVAQCDGIEAPTGAARPAFDPIDACDRIVFRFDPGPRIDHRGSQACYVPGLDEVWMPRREAFTSPPEYYSTLFHELVHSTGASHRLARKGVVDRTSFASHTYSQEELVAECGAAFLCNEGGISTATLANSAAYIASWSRLLRSEPRWIVHAAAQASKAADLILGRSAKHGAESPAEAA
jgi:antirestriction protein ArdC